jgi:adenylate cyclase
MQPTFVNVYGVMQECILLIVAALVLSIGVARAREIAFRQMVGERERANLARYFSPGMVDVLAQRDRPLDAPRRQDCAILFADVVGFSALSERIGAERTLGLLREIHGMMAAEVFRHDGTVDKYIGDALMATFGTPLPGPRDAANALRCARSILASIENWNGARAARAERAIEVGIGIHYGPVVLGDIGDERRLEFAVIGDTVNVANRLEALTREHAVRLIVSDELLRVATVEAADIADLRPFGEVMVRGRQTPVLIYGLVSGAAAVPPPSAATPQPPK